MDKLKRAQSLVGTNNDGGRPEDDFYPTPPPATEALLRVEKFSEKIWEPACGDGAISKVLIEHGYLVESSDKYDHGYGRIGVDFLKTTSAFGQDIITNPPFKDLFSAFVLHAYKLEVNKFALFGKLAALEGEYRSTILETTHLSRVWVFRKRMKLTRNGKPYENGGMIAFAWYVWERGWNKKAEIDWI